MKATFLPFFLSFLLLYLFIYFNCAYPKCLNGSVSQFPKNIQQHNFFCFLRILHVGLFLSNALLSIFILYIQMYLCHVIKE